MEGNVMRTEKLRDVDDSLPVFDVSRSNRFDIHGQSNIIAYRVKCDPNPAVPTPVAKLLEGRFRQVMDVEPRDVQVELNVIKRQLARTPYRRVEARFVDCVESPFHLLSFLDVVGTRSARKSTVFRGA